MQSLSNQLSQGRKSRSGNYRVCNLGRQSAPFLIRMAGEAVPLISTHLSLLVWTPMTEWLASTAAESSMNRHMKDMYHTARRSTRLI